MGLMLDNYIDLNFKDSELFGLVGFQAGSFSLKITIIAKQISKLV